MFCVATLDKLLTHNCLQGRQGETTSLISSPGGIKANEPAFGQRTVTNTTTTTIWCILTSVKLEYQDLIKLFQTRKWLANSIRKSRRKSINQSIIIRLLTRRINSPIQRLNSPIRQGDITHRIFNSFNEDLIYWEGDVTWRCNWHAG